MPQIVNLANLFLITEPLLPNSVTRQVIFKGLKLVEIAKIENVKCDILSDFQTLCIETPIKSVHQGH